MVKSIYLSKHLCLRMKNLSQETLSFLVQSVVTLVLILTCCTTAFSQAAITLGIQEIYDDNIFLENDIKRPVPLVVNDALEQDLEDGRLSISNPKQRDGNPNDDIITNVFIGASSTIPQIEQWADSSAEGKVGFMLFSKESDQSRLTLDGLINLRASEHLVPDPFYANISTALDSRSNSITVAEGTSAESTETYTLSGTLGVAKNVTQNTNLDLGYSAGYLNDLGQFLFEDSDDSDLNDEGADYHTHTGRLAVNYTVSPKLTVGVLSDAGVQLFLDSPSNDTGANQDAGDLDRTNANASLTTTYRPTQRLSFRGAAGVSYSSLHKAPEAREFVIVNPEDGTAQTIVEQDDRDNQAFVFSGYLDYLFTQGSVFSLSAVQTLSTERDGDRIIIRSFSANVNSLLTDRLTLVGGTTYVTYAGGDSLGSANERWEASASLSYALRQNLALVAGYNYSQQNANNDGLAENLRFLADDYTVNRAFVALNFGLVGLPL